MIHPELREGEVFLFNLNEWKTIQFVSLNLKSKRLGNVAYEGGEAFPPSFRPVFAEKAEVEAAGM